MTHLFVGCDGELFDTRVESWSTKPPLRKNFDRHHREIHSVADLKATLRAGRFTDVGGYPLYFITSDGAALSFEAVRAEFHQVVNSVRHTLRDGWRVVACDINYEDGQLTCDHTNKPIPSAYGEDEDEDEEEPGA